VILRALLPLALLLLPAPPQLLLVPLLLLPAPLQLLLVPMPLLPVSMMLPLVPLLLLNVPLLPLRPSTAATPPPCTRRPDCMLLLLHEPRPAPEVVDSHVDEVI
jgi:hypothetical protein